LQTKSATMVHPKAANGFKGDTAACLYKSEQRHF
jgi:hypothetical protein